MNQDISEKIRKINGLTSEMDALYHRAALKIGLADSAMHILYTICNNGESCLLSDIYRQSGISKQTINSALRKLEEKGVLYLEQYKGKAKKVLLTETGKTYMQQTAARLYEAECRAFETWTEDEINTYIHLLTKYETSLHEQIAQL